MNSKKQKSLIGIILTISATAPMLPAASNGWKSTTSNDWSNTSNWTAGHAPILTDQVTFDSGTVNISLASGTYTAASIGSDQGLQLNQSGGNLTVIGSFEIDNPNPAVGSHPVLYAISAGSLTVDGTFSLTYGANANQTGGTVYVGSLNLGGSASGTNGYEAYNFSGGNLSARNITIYGDFSPGAAFNWSGGEITSLSNITLEEGGNFALTSRSSNKTLSSNVTLTDNGVISVTQITSTLNLTGIISGSFSSLEIGSNGASSGGLVFLSGNNTYDGGTTINAGVLQLGSATGAGSGNVSVMSGAALDLFGQTVTSSGTLTLSNVGFGNGALINSSATAATWSGNVTLASNASIAEGNITLSGVISGSGKRLTLGNGTLILSGNNTYSGGTVINGGGTVSISANNGLGNSTGAVEIGNGTLEFTGNVSTSRAFTLDAGGTNTIDLSGATLNTAVTGTISGAGGLTLKGAGDVYLYGTNSYSGGTTITNGTVVIVDADANLGSTGTTLALSGDGLLDVSGTFTLSRNVTVGTGGGEIYIQSGGLTVGNLISGAGRLIVGGGGGMVTLSGVNTYTGGTDIVAGGTVSISADSGLGNSTGGGEVAQGDVPVLAIASLGAAVVLDGIVADGDADEEVDVTNNFEKSEGPNWSARGLAICYRIVIFK